MDFSPIILTIMLLYLDASAQHQNVRVAPGVPPQHYDPNQQYMQQPPPPQHHNQFQQHQVPQHHQPPPGQHQQFQQAQVPIQLQPQHGIPQHAVPQQHGVPQIGVPQQHVSPQSHGHSHAGGHGGPGHGQPLLDTSNIANERQHIQEHMDLPIDTSQMSEQELQFHYFKMHDSDNNNKLDGCELVKSLIHWHDQSNHDPRAGVPIPEPKVFKDDELVQMIDPILENDDKNHDGFIDYGEFVQAQAAAASKNPPPKH